MYLLGLFLPFLGSFISFIGGNFFGSRGAIFLTCLCMGLSVLISFFLFYEIVFCGSTCIITLGNWMQVADFTLDWSFLFDSITASMFVIVTVVSFLVHLYSTDYMKADPHKIRFFCYLSLFTFFMLFLVSADNLVQMFVGWEGVGLCSYLLVNFWYTRIAANKASLKAIVVNRFGDFGIYMALMAIFVTFKSLDYALIFPLVSLLESSSIYFLNSDINSIDFICFCIFIGVIGKSAQIGLHTWLPDAMEGPTPVSALIHAATMVTAGIFLVVRCNILFEYSPKILFMLCVWGSFTSFFAASTGILQNDLKKVIAFSTCSQLGYMLFCCGLSYYSLALFHLFNHAFFKALLFLSAGCVIHALFDEQDMRKFGGLVNYLPFTYMMFFVASFSLMGFPFLTGFYSKDIILEFSFNSFSISGVFCYWLGTLSALFTAIYSFRLFFLTFYTIPNFSNSIFTLIEEASNILIICFIVLFLFSIFIGYFTKEIFISLGSDVWSNSIFTSHIYFFKYESEFIAPFYKMIPVIFSLLGSFMVFIIYYYSEIIFFSLVSFFSPLVIFLSKRWFIDNFYNKYVVDSTLFFSYYFNLKSIDKGLIEYMGPFGLSLLLSYISNSLRKISSGFLFHYIFYFLFFVITMMFFLFITVGISSFNISYNYVVLFIFWCFFYYFFK